MERVETERLVLYHVGGASFLDYMKGGYFTTRIAGLSAGENPDYQTLGHRIRFAPFGYSGKQLDEKEVLIWNQLRFLFLEESTPTLPKHFQTDYLILGQNRVSSLSQLPKQLKFHTLVIDGSNSRRTANRLQEEAKAAGIPFHNIIQNGALILEKNANQNRN
jgi:hypothetical protein